MRVTLIFPTGTDPRSPHLALPSLAAVLRKAGIDTELLDLDIDGMLALLEPDHLAEAGDQLRMKARGTTGAGRDALRRLLGLADSLPERMADALATFHDPHRFYEPNELITARETIFNGLDLVSTAAAAPVRYNIFPICYDVEGIDIQSLADLVRVTEGRDANLFADYWERDVFPRLEARNPGLVGITITNRQQVIPGLQLARQLRERGHYVVLGGTVFTKFAKELARLPRFFEFFADGVVVYEGETALIELAEQLEGRRDFAQVPNYLYLNGGEVRSTKTHVEDVTTLPTPDFAGLPLHRYLTPQPVLPIMYGKGCYFNRCKFCDIPYINRIAKKPYRMRPPELVVADLLELNRSFGCRHFEFTDEALAPKLLERLAEALRPHRERGFCFVGYARLEPGFTPELCGKLGGMGMKKLFFGLESGSQETLDHMDKGIRISDVPAILRSCQNAGIRFHIFSIIGFPEETEVSARETCRFFIQNAPVIDHPGNSFDIHPFGLELRTRYSEEAEQMGVLIAPEALAKEFVIGVEARWANTRGLSQAQVEGLLDEFQLLLRRFYSCCHASAQPPWPAFEEFAVLYGDRYGKREFPYRISLPDLADPRQYRLRWNPAALVEPKSESSLRVSSRSGHVEVTPQTYETLGRPGFRSVREMLTQFCAGGPDDAVTKLLIRQTIDELIQKSLLQLEPCTVRNEKG